MYVKGVRIKDVRGFRSGHLAVDLKLTRPGKEGQLAGWTVIAGRNGAGKSTFLKAIALGIAGPGAARTLQESFAGWVHSSAVYGEVSLELEPSPRDLLKGGKPRSQPLATRLIWVRRSGPEPTLEPPPINKKTVFHGPWSDNPKGWFVAGYGPFRRLSGTPSDAQRLVGPNRFTQLVSLFREDASLVEGVEWLKDIYLRRFEKRRGAANLLDGILHLLNDGLLPEGNRVTKVDSEGLWVTRGKLSLPLQELSDGYRTATALVIDMSRQLQQCYGEFKLQRHRGTWTVPYPGVVLIDEIDVHLHISWQQRIGFWLKEHFPNIQFLVTTHSPYICQAADPGGLIRLPAPGEDQPAKHVSGDLFSVVVNGSTDDAAMTELFGLERTYSWKSEKLREQVAQLEAKVISGRASAKDRRELHDLSERLPKTGTASVEKLLSGLVAKR